MIEICPHKSCTGCGVCVNVCPHKAVSMSEGSAGALYPTVDQDRCIDCGLCVNNCPVNSPVAMSKPKEAYAAYADSCSERMSSSSGGVASMLTRSFIENGGVVYGCSQGNGIDIKYICVDSIQNASVFKGSKYVRCDTDDVYRNVRKDLHEGKNVLFIGLPCQVAGLKNFIEFGRNLSERLYTADLCCHGTPSIKTLKDHVNYLGFSSTADKAIFREKDAGISYVFRLNDSEGRCLYRRPARRDYYMAGFLSGLFLRESCFTCRYACVERCSDITLADYWAIGRSYNPEMTADKGLSAVLVNTAKGQALFNLAASSIVFEERPMAEALRNGRFISPSSRPKDYDSFMKSYVERGYGYACREYLPSHMRTMLYNEIRSAWYRWPLRQFVRKILKKV